MIAQILVSVVSVVWTSNLALISFPLFLFWKNCKYKKDLGNAHPALCSSLINVLFYFRSVYTTFLNKVPRLSL
jgi:hypothetical protein